MPTEPLVMAVILAHQGGWDEILLVLTPIVAIILVLRLVKKRIDAAGPIDGATPGDPAGGAGADDDLTGIDDIDDVTDDVKRR